MSGVADSSRICWLSLTKHAAYLAGVSMLLVVPFTGGCDNNKPSSAPPLKRNEALLGPRKASTATSATSPTATTAQRPTHKRARRLCARMIQGRPFPTMDVGHAEARGAGSLGERIRVGGSWTWINLWAAWCGPCKEEMPRLLSWQKKLAGKMTVQFVSLDDDRRQLVRFLNGNHKLRASYWLPEGKTQEKWLKQVGLHDPPELPVQVLVDPQGNIRCIVQGAIDQDDFPRIREIVSH